MLIAFLQFLSDFSEYHPFWTSILTVFFTAQICKWIKNSDKRFPPGPLGLPFVGYLPFLRKNAHQELAKWQQTYGNIYSLKIGSRSALVLGDFKSIKEASQNPALLGNLKSLHKVSGRVKHFGAMNPKDRHESLSFTRGALNDLAKGGNKLEDFVTEEITKFVDRLDGSTGRTEIHLRSMLRRVVLNISTFMIMGVKPGQNTDLTVAIEDFFRLSPARFNVNAASFLLPWLDAVIPHVNDQCTEVKKNMNELVRLIGREVDAHEKNLDLSSLEDYMDHFLAQTKKTIGDPSTFTKGVLTGNCLLLLETGVDATISAIEWFLLIMAQHQDIQEKVYQEILESWGQASWPAWKDMKPMPYLEAVLMEVGRWKTLNPLGTPHWTLSETKVGNYVIPKDTMVLNSFHSVHMDPEAWDEPDKFNPDRFLSMDKKTVKTPEFFLPFSYGKRTCPGDVMGKMQVVTFVAAALQHFKMVPPCSGLNMDENLCGLVLRPAFPYVKVQHRNECC